MEYRIQVYIRRKGEPMLDGEEFKTEEFDSLDDLKEASNELISNVIYEDSESVFRNEGENEG